MKMIIDFRTVIGEIKPMNAVNNGPVYTENADQNGSNLEDFKKANIPYARVHDASICYEYGGEHTVDVMNIFPDFNADPNDPAAYDFTLTDEYLHTIMLAGSKVFFRLGHKIEHWKKHYGTVPPADFRKWAEICEHIIAHCNEGWADGHKMGIEYWEIWNEPDISKCWTGTMEEYFELYAVTSKHLKERFPSLKIGGPALSNANENLIRPFFEKIKKENLPFDFFSWHAYASDVKTIVDAAQRTKALLNEYGFDKTESILNEWNYVKGWGEPEWTISKKTEHSAKGAAFIAAVMTACQKENVDMLMYYDARINSTMNGLFDIITFEKIKGYYPVCLWGEMLNMRNECKTECSIPNIYAVASADGDKKLAMITYYTDSDDALPITFRILSEKIEKFRLFRLDETHDMTPYSEIYFDNEGFTITLQPNTITVLRT